MSFIKDWNDFWGETGRQTTSVLKQLGMTDDDINYVKYLAGSVPYVQDIVNASEGNQKALSYMNNHKISWSDVRYVTNLPGYGSGSALVRNGARGYNYVSQNIGRLYSH